MIRIVQGNALHRLSKLQPGIFHTVVTSPPYWGLRDYGTTDQIGMELTPEHYIARMIRLFRELRRLLREDGTVWLNLGDSYYGSGKGSGGGSISEKYGGQTIDTSKNRTLAPHAYLKPKDLVGIPWRVALALQRDGWYLRSDIIWQKPNVMPESVTDRPTRSHEYIFLFSKSEEYYYDHNAIKEPVVSNDHDKKRMQQRTFVSEDSKHTKETHKLSGRKRVGDGELRNKRTVWTVPTSNYKGAHFATFPEKLIEPCILASSPEKGFVLDPFTGSGTTAVVCKKHNRNFVGVELNPEYIKLAQERVDQCGTA